MMERGVLALRRRGRVALLVAWMVMTSFQDVGGNEERFGEKGRVIELDDSNFDSAISTFDYILVDFYAPWCGHCQRLSPQLDSAASVLADGDKPIVLAKINADKFTGIASKYEVSAYPTLKFFIKGFPTDYTGPRKAELLIPYLKKMAAPDVSILKSNREIQEFIEGSNKIFPMFIGFDINESLLAGLAKQYKKRAWFAVAEDFTDEVMMEYDFDKKPALLALRPEYREQDTFYGPFEGGFLNEFIQQSLLPLCVPIRYDTLKLIQEDARPIALTIMKDEREDESLQIIKMLKAAASGNRDLIFAFVGLAQWEEFVDTFNVGEGTKLPIIIVWNGDSEYHSVVGLETLNVENLGLEINSFLEGYRSLYILLFVIVILMVIWNMSISEKEETVERENLRQERLAEGRQFNDATESSIENTENSESKGRLKED
ncbi:hypothetical protein SUGI_0925500 [Cryptomeria japonica]|nr:hypothetical protein SUGI_0925500 [Cryptomeria japonica]